MTDEEPTATSPNLTPASTEHDTDRLRLDYVAARAQKYDLKIPNKLRLIDELAFSISIARRRFREDSTKP